MELDEKELFRGKKFIVGEWRVDYIVNAWSNDLAHIPATEFKSDDGRDFSAITFTFFEDNTVVLKNDADGKEVKGEWEQTGWTEYRYTLKDFMELPEGDFRDAAEKLEVFDGCLVFSIGFLAVGMKKIKDGAVAEPKDPLDAEMTAEEAEVKDIVGEYEVACAMAYIDGTFGIFPRDKVEAEAKRKAEAGEEDDDELLDIFDMIVEFLPDHTVVEWAKIPGTVSEDMINEALKAGEITAVKNGYFTKGSKEWKYLGGKYYYNTQEEREVMGEKLSPWDELKFDEEGLMLYSEMMKIRKK